MKAFSPVVRIETPPPPQTQASVYPSPPLVHGGAYSLVGEGVEESQFGRGDRHWGSIGMYVLCALCVLYCDLELAGTTVYNGMM